MAAQSLVDMADLQRERQREELFVDRHEHRFRDDAQIGIERLFVERVTEGKEARLRRELRTPVPEKLLPRKIDDQAQKWLRARGYDHAAFIEKRERIALRAAALSLVVAALGEDCGVVPIGGGFGLGKGDPHQSVE